MRQQISSLYFAAYKKAWLKLLTSVQVRQFMSLNDAVKQIATLSSSNSPVVQLFQVVITNLDISCVSKKEANFRGSQGDFLGSSFPV